MRKLCGFLLLCPFLFGFDVSRGREALDLAFENLYGAELLVGIELTLKENEQSISKTRFAMGRKHDGDEVRTLLYTGDGSHSAPRALLFQEPGKRDRIFVSDGSRGEVRPLSAGNHTWPMFGSDFSYEDFRRHRADEYRIEVLGTDKIDGEDCRVLRLRPTKGPYTVQLAWLSTSRPVLLRMDYFDEMGLWKRYRARPDDVEQNSEYWVPMRDEMLDLRTGRRTVREIRNLLIDVEVPDQIFTLTQLARGRMPSF